MNVRDIYYHLKFNIQLNTDTQLLKIKQPKLISDINYYDVLGLAKDASEADIRHAYRKLSLAWHPDKSTLANAADKFKLLNQVFSVLSDRTKRASYDTDNSALHKPVNRIGEGEQSAYDLIYSLYKNQQTFVALAPITDIPRDSLIILDDYAFDVNELIDYAKSDLLSLNHNPHITKRGQREFSAEAKAQMLKHPLLHPLVFKLNKALAKQLRTISRETVNQVKIMLLAIDSILSDAGLSEEEKLVRADEARDEFVKYFSQLSVQQQTLLNDFVIEVKIIGGGMQGMTFKFVLKGGTSYNDCIQTLQIYGWQFVVTCDHDAINIVPANVHLLAREQESIIRVPQSNRNRANSAATSTMFTNQEIPITVAPPLNREQRQTEYLQQRAHINALTELNEVRRQELLDEQERLWLMEEVRQESRDSISFETTRQRLESQVRQSNARNQLTAFLLRRERAAQHGAPRSIILFDSHIDEDDEKITTSILRMFQPLNNNSQQQPTPPMSSPLTFFGLPGTLHAASDIPAGTVVATFLSQQAFEQREREMAQIIRMQTMAAQIARRFNLHQAQDDVDYPDQDQTQDQNRRGFR